MIVTILGSNSGDRHQLLKDAVVMLQEAGRVISKSACYETEPWGFEAEENFLNQVVVFDTDQSPIDFLHYCLAVEKKLGRVRKSGGPRYSSRPIDIDMLFCDSQIIDLPELTVPHPRMCERNFVLTPLAEVMPDFVHPVNHHSVRELLHSCTDHSAVLKCEE